MIATPRAHALPAGPTAASAAAPPARAGAWPRLRAAHAALRAREPLLVAFADACLALGAAALVAAAVDPRTVGGVPAWLKPAKFFGSTALFALTWAWAAGLVRADRRATRPLRWARRTLVGSGAFELVYITWQAARAEASHFNVADPVHGALYALMGVGAVLLIGSNVPLARAVARHPAEGADPALARAAALGLGLTVLLGGVLGGYMSAQAGHAVGAEAGHQALTGWNRTGGDLRVAHFFGLHAAQALPLAAWGAGALGVRRRDRLVTLVAAAWAAGTVLAFAQAVRGRPFPFG